MLADLPRCPLVVVTTMCIPVVHPPSVHYGGGGGGDGGCGECSGDGLVVVYH